MANPRHEHEEKPKTLREAGRHVWLESLNLLAEYGALLVFSAGAAGAESARQRLDLPYSANLAFLVAEGVAAITMIAPKAIRALGNVIQVLIFTCHDVAYAVRHGTRRPVPESTS